MCLSCPIPGHHCRFMTVLKRTFHPMLAVGSREGSLRIREAVFIPLQWRNRHRKIHSATWPGF